MNLPEMWCGEWIVSQNKSPSVSTLTISDKAADCGGPPWCGLIIRMRSGQKNLPGEIENMDDLFRHMTFRIYRTADKRTYDRYDARIFVYRNKMAGNYSTIGIKAKVPPGVFFATKR